MKSISIRFSFFLLLILPVCSNAAIDLSRPPLEAFNPPISFPTKISFESSDLIHVANNLEDTVGEIYLSDESVEQVVALLGDLTGKKILSSGNLPGVFINFDSQGAMSREDGISAIESLLYLNGVSVSRMGDEFIRVIANSEVKRHSPELIHHSTMFLPASEKVYTKLFRIKYMNWDELISLVNSSVTQGVGGSELFPTTKSLLITDSLVNLQKIEALITQLDIPSQQEIMVRKVKFLSAEDLKTKLEQQISGGLGLFVEGKVSITADERSGQIIVVTDKKNQPLIERFIRIFDVNTGPIANSRVIHLKYAEALEVVRLVDDILNKQNSKKADKSKVLPFDSNDESALSEPRIVVASNIRTIEDIRFSDYAAVVADERTNSVVIYGTRKDLNNVERLISEVDVVLAQVRIDVVITEVTLTDDVSRGIEKFGISYDENDEIRFQMNENTGLPFSFSGSITDLFLSSWTIPGFTMSTIFDTAKQNSDVTILSSPSLITTHNREAFISAGESRPVITSTDRDSTGLNSRSQVQFKDIGIQLKIKPLIGENGVVQLEIEQVVESVVDEVLIDGNSQPVIGKREAVSFITVNNGDLVVLAGLQERTIRKVGGKMAFWGRIPLLGRLLFSSDRERELNRELIIFLKPTVFKNSGELMEHSQRVRERIDQEGEVSRYVSEIAKDESAVDEISNDVEEILSEQNENTDTLRDWVRQAKRRKF